MPVESMSSALDRVASELKASIDLAATDKAAEAEAEPATKPAVEAPSAAEDAPDPGAATSLPDPSEPAEKFADAMAKPAANGAAAPAKTAAASSTAAPAG